MLLFFLKTGVFLHMYVFKIIFRVLILNFVFLYLFSFKTSFLDEANAQQWNAKVVDDDKVLPAGSHVFAIVFNTILRP